MEVLAIAVLVVAFGGACAICLGCLLANTGGLWNANDIANQVPHPRPNPILSVPAGICAFLVGALSLANLFR